MIDVDSEATVPRLILMATSCTSGTCPSIFRTDRGTILVQGYAVDAKEAGVALAADELLVEIPAELLTAAGLAPA